MAPSRPTVPGRAFAPAVAALLTAASPTLAAFPSAPLLARAAASSTVTPATDAALFTLDPRRPTQVIAFHVAGPVPLDRRLEVTTENARIAGVVPAASVLAGRTIGYAFVQPAGPGETTVRIGSAPVRVRIVPGPALTTATPLGPSPELLSPRSGAAVWGTMAVGVGAWTLPGETLSDLRAMLRLRVGEGEGARLLEPTWAWDGPAERPGPYVLASFTLTFDDEPTGPCSLTPVRLSPGSPAETAGDPVTIQVVRPAEGTILTGECEADYGLADPRFVGPPAAPPSEKDATASGGRFLNNAGRDPRFRFPVRVSDDEGPGWYQVVLTAAGDPGVGALPTIGLTIDEAQRPRTSGAIATAAWHRTPIGAPIRLGPGFHTLRCEFVNDFAARGTDRNLRLDRVEVARVADARPAAPASGENPMMDADSMMRSESPMTGTPMMGAAATDDPMAPIADASMDSAASAAIPRAAGWPATAGAAESPTLRVALERPLDALPCAGVMEIAARTWSADSGAPPPVVALIIDGRITQRQRSDAPRFLLPPEVITPAGSTIELLATDTHGGLARTPPQRVLPSPIPSLTEASDPRQSCRLTTHDRAWALPAGITLKVGQGGDQRLSAPLAHATTTTIRLPDDLHGEFDLFLEARGAAPQPVEIALLEGLPAETAAPPALFTKTIPSYMDAHELTPPTGAGLMLHAGPKRLAITLPAPAKGKFDKQALWTQAIRLLERPRSAAEPAIAVEYPADGQPVRSADAIVAAVASPERLAWAEVVIDGRPTGLRHDLRRPLAGLGRVCVPVLLADLEPGPHTLALRVADARGRVATSALRTVSVVAPPTPGSATDPTPYERAVRLLDRLAFGPEPRELADCLRLGPGAYLRARLSRAAGPQPGDAAAQALGETRFPNPRSGYDVPRRALQRSIATDNPVRARLVLWAQNHFSTWLRKDEAWRKADEDAAFAALGAARFPELLACSATGPAMLRYLDQERSYGSRLNENYAREIMELHTLGVHAGYTQADVTSLARVLTGWTTTRHAPTGADRSPDDDGLVDAFRLDPALADPLTRPADVIGARFDAGTASLGGPAGRVGVALEVLSAHPAAARFVCTKLAAHFTSESPPDDLVSAMASAFARTGGDLREAVISMAAHPAFWIETQQPRLAHALDYALRLARAGGHASASDAADFLAASGKGLFDRATPDGYPEDDAQAMDSNALLQRWKLAAKSAADLAAAVPPDVRYAQAPITPALAATIVDLLSVRLTGRLLGPASRDAALAVLADTAPDLPARPQDFSRDKPIQTVAAFIAQTPEASLK